jgi:hypothetical protein
MRRIDLVNLADKQGIEANAPPVSAEPGIFYKNKGHKLNRAPRILQMIREYEKREHVCVCVTDRVFKQNGRGLLSVRWAPIGAKQVAVSRGRSHKISQRMDNYQLHRMCDEGKMAANLLQRKWENL